MRKEEENNEEKEEGNGELKDEKIIGNVLRDSTCLAKRIMLLLRRVSGNSCSTSC
jgi:hypothetical protein